MAEYPNRSDLRNPATRQVRFTGQTYGTATQQAASQQAVAPGSAPTTRAGQQMASAQTQTGPTPGMLPLTRASERPNEPITTGVPSGPGANMMPSDMVAPGIVPDDPVLDQLLMLYRAYPEDGLRVLLSRYWNVNA
jgi:hypothetical protein